MVKRFPFALGWRPLGSRDRRWQLQDCVDVAEAAASRRAWRGSTGVVSGRVYDMVTVPARAGSVRLVRRSLLAEGVARPAAG